jgi:hypothetical protein
MLHVSSDDQEHEQGGGDDYPIVELHQFWHVGSICHYIESNSGPVGAFFRIMSTGSIEGQPARE